jgi:hypothetical protein
MCFEGDFRGVVVSLGSDEKAQDDGWERRGGGDIVSRRGWGDFVVPAGASVALRSAESPPWNVEFVEHGSALG